MLFLLLVQVVSDLLLSCYFSFKPDLVSGFHTVQSQAALNVVSGPPTSLRSRPQSLKDIVS